MLDKVTQTQSIIKGKVNGVTRSEVEEIIRDCEMPVDEMTVNELVSAVMDVLKASGRVVKRTRINFSMGPGLRR